jgi:hypothetical protein
MSRKDKTQIKLMRTLSGAELCSAKRAFREHIPPEALMQLFFSRRRNAAASISALLLAFIMPLAGSPLAAFAQDDGLDDAPPAAMTTVPGGVARIDALAGDVAIQRGDSNDTLAAVANAPVLAADYITTGQNGHAEVGFDGRSAVRLGQDVQIRFAKVDAADRQLQLAAGTIDLRLFGDTDGQSSIDTPSISVVPRTAGSFRVAVDAQGETSVTVRSGRADIVTPQGSQSLEPGTTVIADGPAANPQVQSLPALSLDAFDGYNAERDHIYQSAVADSQYVNPNIQGIGDLNANGRWVDDSSYGNVWIPATVAAGWAPYRDGNWTWEDGYGWTWVAAEPWGWAPYHYGRWYFSSAYHQWAWYPPAPGRVIPAWSPALVGFVGFNIGAVSVGIGFGNIGWVPLAPYEAFHPWWGPHASAFATTSVSINYRNIAVVNSMTSVTRENFQAGRFGNPMVVSQAQIHDFHPMPMQGALPIVPSQANLRFTQRSAPPQLAVHAAFASGAFAGHVNVVMRTPFVQQQASVSRFTHVAYHPGVQPQGAGAPSFSHGPVGSPAGNAAPSFARPAGDSWSRFNTNRTPEANGGGAPGYAHQASPEYERPAAPAYTHQSTPEYTHQSAPAYTHQSAPGYTRPAAPAYTRPAAPAYTRQGAASYARPQQQSHPQARPSHTDDHHDH